MEIIIENKIGEKVESFIAENGTTKTWIAKSLNMSNQNLHAVLKSKNPSIETLIKFATFFNCQITDLFSYTIDD